MATFHNPFPLFSFYLSHIFGEKIDVFILTAIAIFMLHSFTILFITSRFSAYINKPFNGWRAKTCYLVFTLTTLLILFTHLADLLYFSYVMDCMQVFSDPLTSFYFSGEMYTTLGYGTYYLAPEYRGLPFIIGFTGLFSASISGAGMFSMLQDLGRAGRQLHKTE